MPRVHTIRDPWWPWLIAIVAEPGVWSGAGLSDDYDVDRRRVYEVLRILKRNGYIESRKHLGQRGRLFPTELGREAVAARLAQRRAA